MRYPFYFRLKNSYFYKLNLPVAQYPNGADFPNLLLTCMVGRNFKAETEAAMVSKSFKGGPTENNQQTT